MYCFVPAGKSKLASMPAGGGVAVSSGGAPAAGAGGSPVKGKLELLLIITYLMVLSGLA